MHPKMEIEKHVEVLPSLMEKESRGGVLVINHPPLKRGRGRPPINPLVRAQHPPKNPARVGGIENTEQKVAFDYYLSLGSERSLQKVATHFSAQAATLYDWSKKFHWVDRVRVLENQPDLEVAKRNLARFYRLKTSKMVIKDPDDPMNWIPNPDYTGNAAKEITAAVVALDKNSMEGEAHEKEMNSGRSGRGPGGVQVNVVIQR